MTDLVKTILSEIECNEPGTEAQLQEAEQKLGVKFPKEYREFILQTNGAEGGIGDYGYLVVWPVDVIAQYNEDYEVEKYNTGLVYFGSDGGDIAFAFDKRDETMPIVLLPFTSIELEEIEEYGDTFDEFINNLYNDCCGDEEEEEEEEEGE